MNQWIKPAAGLALIAAGALGLMYGGFSYTKEEHQADLGGLEFSMKEKESVDVPKWLSAGAIAAGALLLVFGRRK